MNMRGQRRRADVDQAEVQIPIPAMLDMTFQLLSFFILTFNPPHAGEGQMDMTLPAVGAAKAKDAEQADPFALSATDVEAPADVTVAVESSNGGIGKITVREREKNTAVADIKELRILLQRLQKELGQANIKVEAESRLKYAGLIEIMDACLAAKFQSVGFVPPPDLGKSK
jgi:biopolymer transport protein ExbD